MIQTRRAFALTVSIDETKPQCLRCTSAGFVCSGYPENLPFINSSPASWHQLEPSSEQLVRMTRIQPSLTLLDDDIFRAYLKQELQAGNILIDNRWPGFSALDAPNGLPRECITSFAAALFGRRTGSQQARQAGVRLYAETLTKLNVRLSQTPESDLAAGELALSIGILAVCEVSH